MRRGVWQTWVGGSSSPPPDDGDPPMYILSCHGLKINVSIKYASTVLLKMSHKHNTILSLCDDGCRVICIALHCGGVLDGYTPLVWVHTIPFPNIIRIGRFNWSLGACLINSTITLLLLWQALSNMYLVVMASILSCVLSVTKYEKWLFARRLIGISMIILLRISGQIACHRESRCKTSQVKSLCQMILYGGYSMAKAGACGST